jgi:transcriptional regulator with XRE-family HTH domain
MELRQRIKDCINEKGIKQCVIARKAGISPKQFSAMMTGKRKIYADEYYFICEALNVTVNEFIKPKLTPNVHKLYLLPEKGCLHHARS